VLNTQANPR